MSPSSRRHKRDVCEKERRFTHVLAGLRLCSIDICCWLILVAIIIPSACLGIEYKRAGNDFYNTRSGSFYVLDKEIANKLSCDVTLHPRVSPELRDDLAAALDSDDVQLIFMYARLHHGNKILAEPGACPVDGVTADHQTPLVWTLHPQGGHYGRAYMMLPVAWPRVYSLGLFSAQVKHLWHAYLDVIVEDGQQRSGNCWERQSPENKTQLMFEAMRTVADSLFNFTGNSLALQHRNHQLTLCYAQPFSDSSSKEYKEDALSIIRPYCRLYYCEVNDHSGDGVSSALHRHSFMQVVYIFFFMCSVASVPVQFHLAFLLVKEAHHYGDRFPSPHAIGGTVLIPRHITALQVPYHLSIAGLLSHRTWLGRKPFRRLVHVCTLVLLFILYVGWPVFLIFDFLSPHQVHPQETFETCTYSWLSFSVIIGGALFWVVLVLAYHEDSSDSGRLHSSDSEATANRQHQSASGLFTSHQCASEGKRTSTALFGEEVLKITSSLVRMFPAVMYTPTILLKYLATRPTEAVHIRSSSASSSRKILHYILGFLVLLVGVVWAVLQETVLRIFHCLLYVVLLLATKANMPSLIGRIASSSFARFILSVLVALLLSAAVLCCLTAVFLALYTVFQEFVNIASLVFGAMLMNYPSQSVVIAGWLVAVLTEVTSSLDAYRRPLLAVQEQFCASVLTLVEEEQLCSSPDQEALEKADGYLAIEHQCRLKTGSSSPISWETFFTKGYPYCINTVSLSILEGVERYTSRLGIHVRTPSGGTIQVQENLFQLEEEKFPHENFYDRITRFERGPFFQRIVGKAKQRPVSRKERRARDLDCRVQYALRVRLLSIAGKLLAVIALQAAFVALLISFHMLWKQNNQVNILLIESAILPLLSYWRVQSSDRVLSAQLSDKIRWQMKRCVHIALKEASDGQTSQDATDNLCPKSIFSGASADQRNRSSVAGESQPLMGSIQRTDTRTSLMAHEDESEDVTDGVLSGCEDWTDWSECESGAESQWKDDVL